MKVYRPYKFYAKWTLLTIQNDTKFVKNVQQGIVQFSLLTPEFRENTMQSVFGSVYWYHAGKIKNLRGDFIFHNVKVSYT